MQRSTFRVIAALLTLLFAAAVAIGTARADGAGSAALTRAELEWSKKNFRVAEGLYREALEKGGLTTPDTLDCYVHLGIAGAILGHEKDALSAFRDAVLIDPRFPLPNDAGRKASRLANEARRDVGGVAPYVLGAEAPESVPPDQPFKLTVTMSSSHAALITKVRIVMKEAGSEKTIEQTGNAATKVPFDIPAKIASADQPDETITFRIDALDLHDNRLASIEKKVKVAAPAPVAVAGDGGAPPGDAGAPKEGDEDSDEASEGKGPWSITHGSKKYTAVRAAKAPEVNGVLDDPIWATAPKDTAFFSTRSKPFGQATKEPTTVQVAYDEENLYVAFRCAYAKPGARDDAFPGDETTLFTEAESVSVIVDAVHGHTGAYQFAVSPSGAFGDLELSDQGTTENLDWHGIWQSGAQRGPDGTWTAEFRIPWGTMRMPSHPESFDLGINFARREPTSGEYSIWALHPPATEIFDTNYFGHLDGLSAVYPGQRLYIEPYVAVAFDRTPLPTQSTLTDFSGTNANFRAYAGAYLRVRPPGPFRADATFNPDFSAVNPDQALANFDRFELEFPEARAFFAEDNPRFQFGAPRYLYGDLGAQLFYSRRLGIQTDTAGLTQAVPILWGVKSVLRDGGTEAALMNVETSPAHHTVSLQDNATIGRITETYEGQRIGAIFLNRSGSSGDYTAAGADFAAAIYDRHLQISGFYAASRNEAGRPVTDNTATPPLLTSDNLSGAGEATIGWKSQDVYAQATYMDIGKSFDAPLGYFPITGARAEMFAAGYTPVIRSDLVQQLFIDSQLSMVKDRDTDQRIYDRGVIGASLSTIQNAIIGVSVQPAIENVLAPFPIGNGTITVPAGQYKVLVTQFDMSTAPRRLFVFGAGYQGGDLYDGQRRAPYVSLGFNLGRFSTTTRYQLFLLSYGNIHVTGHELAETASFAYTPRAKSTLLIEANTVSARGAATLATSIQFWTATTLTIALRGTSGSTLDTLASDWSDNPDFSAIVSLALGVTPF